MPSMSELAIKVFLRSPHPMRQGATRGRSGTKRSARKRPQIQLWLGETKENDHDRRHDGACHCEHRRYLPVRPASVNPADRFLCFLLSGLGAYGNSPFGGTINNLPRKLASVVAASAEYQACRGSAFSYRRRSVVAVSNSSVALLILTIFFTRPKRARNIVKDFRVEGDVALAAE
jgi:hypothetical protein